MCIDATSLLKFKKKKEKDKNPKQNKGEKTDKKTPPPKQKKKRTRTIKHWEEIEDNFAQGDFLSLTFSPQFSTYFGKIAFWGVRGEGTHVPSVFTPIFFSNETHQNIVFSFTFLSLFYISTKITQIKLGLIERASNSWNVMHKSLPNCLNKSNSSLTKNHE